MLIKLRNAILDFDVPAAELLLMNLPDGYNLNEYQISSQHPLLSSFVNKVMGLGCHENYFCDVVVALNTLPWDDISISDDIIQQKIDAAYSLLKLLFQYGLAAEGMGHMLLALANTVMPDKNGRVADFRKSFIYQATKLFFEYGLDINQATWINSVFDRFTIVDVATKDENRIDDFFQLFLDYNIDLDRRDKYQISEFSTALVFCGEKVIRRCLDQYEHIIPELKQMMMNYQSSKSILVQAHEVRGACRDWLDLPINNETEIKANRLICAELALRSNNVNPLSLLDEVVTEFYYAYKNGLKPTKKSIIKMLVPQSLLVPFKIRLQPSTSTLNDRLACVTTQFELIKKLPFAIIGNIEAFIMTPHSNEVGYHTFDPGQCKLFKLVGKPRNYSLLQQQRQLCAKKSSTGLQQRT